MSHHQHQYILKKLNEQFTSKNLRPSPDDDDDDLDDHDTDSSDDDDNTSVGVIRMGREYSTSLCNDVVGQNRRRRRGGGVHNDGGGDGGFGLGAMCSDAFGMIDYTRQQRRETEQRVAQQQQLYSGSVTLYYMQTKVDAVQNPHRYRMPSIGELTETIWTDGFARSLSHGIGELSYVLTDLAMRWWIRRQRHIHCELAFSPQKGGGDDDLVMDSYSVTTDGVRCERRSYKNTSYSCCTLLLTVAQEKRMRSFLDSTVGLPLDAFRSRMVPIWPSVRLDVQTGLPSAYWCAMLCVAAMQIVGFFTHVPAHATSVDDVVDLFHVCRTRTIAIAYTPTLMRNVHQRIAKASSSSSSRKKRVPPRPSKK